ncbi:MAG: alpha-galactosidase, partial [Treponema sp.]|nr:alpha-galactosidase [Treponema sp.]
ARLIERYCPDAWVINYTNPMTLCTAALYKAFPKIKAFGCCHEVFHLEDYIAGLVEKWFNVPKPGRKEINVNITGVNHFTWFTKASWNGIDLMPKLKELANNPATYTDKTELALQRIKEKKWFDCDQIVSLELLKTFGALAAAGDRHLAEFIPWILTSEENIHRYGIMRTPYEWRLEEAKNKRAKQFKDEDLIAKPTGEEGVDIMSALMGDSQLITNMNIPNIGQISYLPIGHIVETNAVVSNNSIRPITAEEPPEAVKALVSHIAKEQEIALEAIWNKDDDLLFQAFMMDPLVNLSFDKAHELFDKMKVACSMKYEATQTPMDID